MKPTLQDIAAGFPAGAGAAAAGFAADLLEGRCSPFRQQAGGHTGLELTEIRFGQNLSTHLVVESPFYSSRAELTIARDHRDGWELRGETCGAYRYNMHSEYVSIETDRVASHEAIDLGSRTFVPAVAAFAARFGLRLSKSIKATLATIESAA